MNVIGIVTLMLFRILLWAHLEFLEVRRSICCLRGCLLNLSYLLLRYQQVLDISGPALGVPTFTTC